MPQQTLISAQEMVSLTSQSSSNPDRQIQAQQIEQKVAPEIQTAAQSPSAYHMSDKTKDFLIETGATILGAIVGHELSSGADNK